MEKLSCRRTEFNQCMQIDNRWKIIIIISINGERWRYGLDAVIDTLQCLCLWNNSASICQWNDDILVYGHCSQTVYRYSWLRANRNAYNTIIQFIQAATQNNTDRLYVILVMVSLCVLFVWCFRLSSTNKCLLTYLLIYPVNAANCRCCVVCVNVQTLCFVSFKLHSLQVTVYFVQTYHVLIVPTSSLDVSNNVGVNNLNKDLTSRLSASDSDPCYTDCNSSLIINVLLCF